MLGFQAFDELLGVAESVALEFKSTPYRLDQTYQKQELAKDVSAMANAGGGLIVVGVKTEHDDISLVDTATEIVPVPASMVDVRQYQDIISNWIYPPPEGVNIEWHATPADRSRGLLSIFIPDQSHSRKPFIVNRLFEQEKHLGAIFGYFRRHESDATPVSVHEAQSLMRDGMLLRRIVDAQATSASGIEIAGSRQVWRPADVYRERSDRLLEETQLGGPSYILAAIPLEPIDYSVIFETSQHRSVQLIASPPELRGSGFDIQASYSADIVRGELRRSATPEYKALELWHDGALLFAATGGEDFLCWGRRNDPTKPWVINQVALIESTYLFALLSEQLLTELAANGVEYTLEIRNMCVEGQHPVLRPGPLSRRFDGSFGRRSAPGCDRRINVRWEGRIDPALIAYKLVAHLYAWFGFEHENIPYVDRNGPAPRIDAHSIATMQ